MRCSAGGDYDNATVPALTTRVLVPLQCSRLKNVLLIRQYQFNCVVVMSPRKDSLFNNLFKACTYDQSAEKNVCGMIRDVLFQTEQCHCVPSTNYSDSSYIHIHSFITLTEYASVFEFCIM